MGCRWVGMDVSAVSAGSSVLLGEIVEASSEYVATTDLFGDLLYVNAAFRDRFVVRCEGGVVVAGQSLFEFFTDASRERFMTVAVPASWKTGSWSGELEALNPGG